ncbi:MAG: POTRA domain-containing protein [Bacteroidota bacterium]
MPLNLILAFFLFPQGPSLSDTIPSLADTVQGAQSDSVIINQVLVLGNKVTRRHIIMRELSFRENDTVAYADLPLLFKASQQNLLNTSLFNFVTIDTFDTRNNTVNVMISVKERWYTWPVPIFELADRNFNTWWKTRDFERVNYGFFLNRDNFRGRKERVALIARFGYSELYGFSYTIPYVNRKQTAGIGFSFTYSRNHEISYGSSGNRQLFFKDEENYVREELSAKASFSKRKGIYNSYTVEARYFKGWVEDTVLKLTSDYFTGNRNTMEYFSAEFYYKSDHRDSKAYPLEGYFFDASVTKVGLGILPEERTDLVYAAALFRQYWHLGGRWYWASALRGKISSQTRQPYYTQRGLGYGRDYIRAYEYYVIDGQHYSLLKNNLKFVIVRPKVRSVSAVPLEKFNTFHYALYANLFFDCGYVWDKLYYAVNPLSNEVLYGFGAGIDFVTYYDTVIRLEYGFTKSLESGLFLHFATPI